MPLFIPLLILAGVSLTATAAAFYFDAKTEEEQDRQEGLRASFEEFRAAEGERRAQLARRYQNALLGEIRSRKGIMYGVGKDLRDAAKKLRGHLSGQVTPLRASALRTLLRNLEAKTELAFANVEYLGWLEARVEQRLADGTVPEDAPSLELPPDFPGLGRVIEVRSRRGAPVLPYGRAVVADGEVAAEGKARLFVFGADEVGGVRRYALSGARAALHDGFLAEPGTSFEAKVTRVEPRGAILDFNGLPLLLPSDARVDPRAPTVRNELLSVYPVEWSFDLDWLDKAHTHVVRVSERREASLREGSFSDVGLVVPDELVDSFGERFGELADAQTPWLIQPKGVEAERAQPERLLFQNGERAFQARVHRERGRSRFIVEKLLNDGEDHFDPGGLYASFEVPVIAVAASELLEIQNLAEWDEHFADLDLFLSEEFAAQRRLRASQDGADYFRRWGRLLRELIDYKVRVDAGIEVVVSSADRQRDRRLLVRLRGTEGVRRYVDGHLAEERAHFVLADGKALIGDAWFDPGDDRMLWVREQDARYELETAAGRRIRVHAAAQPYPEIQQRRAIEALRSGKAVNPVIRERLLAPELAERSPEPGRTLAPLPRNIAQDATQRAVLEAAHAERHLYCIQGPPGAGKTTLILEAIRQHLLRDHRARILVVSQSNVAVDNVLAGLAKDEEMRDRLLRVGHRESVDAALLAMGIGLEARHRAYVDSLAAGRVPRGVATLRAAWLEHLGSDLSPDLAEMLVVRHQIVGATCVGLANRRLELTQAEFDLVIVDEAARATPGELLIPLLRARKAILIGDQAQLPPTVDACLRNEEYPLSLEQPEVRAMYAQTLFERLFDALEPRGCAGRLRRQFRMVPDIGEVVSGLFYDGKLDTGRAPAPALLMARPLTWLDPSRWRAYRSRRDGESQVNPGEADLVAGLIGIAHAAAREERWPRTRVAVITSYASQRRELLEAIEGVAGEAPTPLEVGVDTVDAYQGNEADLVIFCATRTRGGIRFLNDRNRLNVALSRARRELVIVGAAGFLRESSTPDGPSLFGPLLEAMKARNALVVDLTSGALEELLPALGPAGRRQVRPEELVERERAGRVRIALAKQTAETIGIIDVGTRSTKLVVGDTGALLERGFSWELFERPAGHTQGFLNGVDDVIGPERRIQLKGLDRMVNTIHQALSECRRHGVPPERVVTFVTGALRGAANLDEVLDHVERTTSVRPRVLSGVEEARWSLLSCYLSLPRLGSAPVLCIDQGGGSTELALGTKTASALDVTCSISRPLGSAGLVNLALNEDPHATGGRAFELILEAARRDVEAIRIPVTAGASAACVGMGGALVKLFDGTKVKALHGRHLSREDVERRARVSIARSGAEAARVRALLDIKRRGKDQSVEAATALTVLGGIPPILAIMDRTGQREITVSGAGLRFGVFFAHALGILGDA